ncbi:MAG: radical SAM protein [Thermodesulfovibrionales bacterium]|nr:radical SAM protein [Thermodesulfovibrionales bacterium]
MENKYLYDIKNDELYEIDDEAFCFFQRCASAEGCEIETLPQNFQNYCIDNNILSKDLCKWNFTSIRQSPIPSIRYLELQVTDKCNLRCKHCYIGKSHNHELPVEKIDKILEEFQEVQGLRVMITGGEPLMHSDFEIVNELLTKYPIRKVLFTNGLLLRRSLLKKLNVDEIQFSIDGMKDGHEALRGKGTFERVISKLKLAKQFGFSISVATVVHRENLNEFDEMETFFRALGVKDWTVDIPIPIGNLKEHPSFQVYPSIGGKYLNYGFGESYHHTSDAYACGLHLISVMANGFVAKCSFYSNTPIGHIDEGLRKVVQRQKPIRIEELECAKINCPELYNCRGGCRYRAAIFSNKNNKEFKKDIFRCYAYGIIKNGGEHGKKPCDNERTH